MVWNWIDRISLGILFLILEFFSRNLNFFVLGVGALITGFVLFSVSPIIESPIISWLCFTGACGLLVQCKHKLHRHLNHTLDGSEHIIISYYGKKKIHINGIYFNIDNHDNFKIGDHVVVKSHHKDHLIVELLKK